MEQYKYGSPGHTCCLPFLNCVGPTPKGPRVLPKPPGIRERQYQPAHPPSSPSEGQALSAKGQQQAHNQYAKKG